MGWKIFDISFNQYDRWFDVDGRIIFRNELKALQMISAEKSSKSIEIGSGTGRFTEALNIDFGIEPSFNMAHISKQRGVKSIVAKGESLPIKNNVFKTAFFIFSICFIDNLDKVLNEVHRILQKKGEIIIGFIPSESTLGKQYIQKKRENHPYYRYSAFFSYEELKTALLEKKFKIVDAVFHLLSDEKTLEHPIQGIDPKANFLIIKAVKE